MCECGSVSIFVSVSLCVCADVRVSVFVCVCVCVCGGVRVCVFVGGGSCMSVRVSVWKLWVCVCMIKKFQNLAMRKRLPVALHLPRD